MYEQFFYQITDSTNEGYGFDYDMSKYTRIAFPEKTLFDVLAPHLQVI